MADQVDRRLSRQPDWPALAELMQSLHDRGHDIAAITNHLVATTPLNDSPPKTCGTASSLSSGLTSISTRSRPQSPQPKPAQLGAEVSHRLHRRHRRRDGEPSLTFMAGDYPVRLRDHA